MKTRGTLPLLAMLMLLVLLLAACGTSTASTRSPTPAPTATMTIPSHPQVFSLNTKGPVLPHGTAAAWDSEYIDPGAMVFYNGIYHMFFNGIISYPAPVSVGYATSTDGRAWTKVSKSPVLLSSQVKYAPLTIFVSSVLVQPDGTWVMYFYTLDNSGAIFGGPATIGRATAPQPTGPWTPDAAPVLQPGKAGSWDAMSVASPSVVRTDTGYAMYYTGVASLNDTHGAIGMATSADGIHWRKYNNPATTVPSYAESDPVLLPGANGAWDGQRLLDPNVVRAENGWVMVYLSAAPPGTAPKNYSAFGYATSSDGITWHKSEANPVLSTLNVSDWLGIYLGNLLYQNGTLSLYFDVGQLGFTNVWMATHQGLLNN
jgi:predicted GH43/DUF377 family glycosyl hydrolase